MTPGKLEVISPSSCAISLIGGLLTLIIWRQAFFSLSCFCCVRETVMFLESSINPQKVMV